MANPYETLGVAPSASQDDIRKAYRKAAKETHPDLNPGKPEAEKRFKEVNAAYDIIGDEAKRKRYDAGEIDETGAERQPERHFYREYAEADPNMRYRRRAESAAGQGNGAGDFDYDIFADLFRGRGDGGQLPHAAPGRALYARDRFSRCGERHPQDGGDAGRQDARHHYPSGDQRRPGAPSQGTGIAGLRRQAGGRLRRDLGSAALRLQARRASTL